MFFAVAVTRPAASRSTVSQELGAFAVLIERESSDDLRVALLAVSTKHCLLSAGADLSLWRLNRFRVYQMLSRREDDPNDAK